MIKFITSIIVLGMLWIICSGCAKQGAYWYTHDLCKNVNMK